MLFMLLNQKSSACCEIASLRMEVDVFGVCTFTPPPFTRTAYFEMEIVLFSTSRSDQRSAASSPFRRPVLSSRNIITRKPLQFASVKYALIVKLSNQSFTTILDYTTLKPRIPALELFRV